MAQPIVPFARPLFLCDEVVARDRGKVDFLGAFHGISPATYPHVQPKMCVVAHLSGGLGDVTTYVDIRHAETGRLVTTTIPRMVSFPNREVLLRLVQRFGAVEFATPGIYLIELCCEHMCIADTRLRLRDLTSGTAGGPK